MSRKDWNIYMRVCKDVVHMDRVDGDWNGKQCCGESMTGCMGIKSGIGNGQAARWLEVVAEGGEGTLG